jgi:Flp pilus assembly protein TadB
MAWFLLILVLLAAAFGILGAVLKLTAIIVFTLVFSVVVLSMIGWWLVKRQLKRFGREFDERADQLRVTRYRKNEAADRLPPAHDDRY